MKLSGFFMFMLLILCVKLAYPSSKGIGSNRSISTTLSRITNGISSTQANFGSSNFSYSSNGRYIAFESVASNLVSGDSNGLSDVFLFDTQTSTMSRLSRGLSSAEANGPSFEPVISSDGAYVVFSSFASNLVSGDTNARTDIFRVQVSTGTIVRVSLNGNGTQANDSNAEPSVSGDGNLVVFTSRATNLIGSDANGFSDIFLRNISAGTTARISISTAGAETYCSPAELATDPPTCNADSYQGKISSDGTRVVFVSNARDLVGSDVNECSDVFLRNLSGGTTSLVSSSSSGAFGNRSSWKADISSNGQYVSFQSRAGNLIASDLNGYVDVFLKNTSTGATTLVSQTSHGSQVKYDSFNASISSDGRFVVFESGSPGYTSWDNNSVSDVFIHDNLSSLTTPYSTLAFDVVGNKKSFNAKISGDGSTIGFLTLATNLVTPDTNAQVDILHRSNPLSGQVVNISPIADLDESGGTQNAFLITRFGSTASSLTVNYAVTGTAISGTDYTALAGSISIPATASSVSVPVNVLTDALVEPNESIVLTIAPDAAYSLGGKDSASVNILIEDAFTVDITATDNVLYEDGLNRATFHIVRAGGTLGDLIVNLAISGNATAGVDYMALPMSIIIPAGQTSVDVTVIGIEDHFGESDETVIATLATGSGYNIGSSSAATVTLKDNDQFEVNVSATDSIANESSTSDTGNFRIDRGTTGMQNLVVNYSLKGIAQNGVDYVSISGSATITAPNQYVDIPVTAISDSLVEGFETVALELLPGEHYTPGPSQTATIVIKEDSSLPVVSIEATDSDANEAGSNSGTFRVTRSGSTASGLVVNFGIGGTAVNGTDYSAISTAVTISTGASYADVTVTGVEDSYVESAETVVIGLQSASTYQVDVVASQAQVNITDNETATVQIVREQAYAKENQSSKGKFKVTRTGELSGALTVNLSYSGTAILGTDYTGPGGTIVIPAGESSKSVELAALSDSSIEGNEIVTVSIGSSGSYAIGTDSSTDVLIVDGTYKVFASLLGITPNADIRNISVSDNARYIIFESSASNLVSGDTNGVSDIFRVDTVNNTISRIVAPGTLQANGASRDPAISANGRYVAFSSRASNFYQDDFNQLEDVFLYDFDTGSTVYVSKGYTYLSQGGGSFEPAISSDASFIAFASDAVNLVDGDTNGVADIFLFERATSSLERVSVDLWGQQSFAASRRPSISSDGNLVSFESKWLWGGLQDTYENVMLFNRLANVPLRVSTPIGVSFNNGYSGFSRLSPDGRSIVFQSYSSKLINDDLNQAPDIFLYNVNSELLSVVSTSESGWLGNQASMRPVLNLTGDIALFISGSRNFGGSFNCSSSAYVKSLTRNTIVAIDNGSLGSCSSPVREASMSLSGKYVVSILASDLGFREILISSNPLK